jgi:hypothetical protein
MVEPTMGAVGREKSPVGPAIQNSWDPSPPACRSSERFNAHVSNYQTQ